MDSEAKDKVYSGLIRNITALTEGENDTVSILSTVACEVFQAFDYVNWAGFYRMVDERTLKVGPYQGTHGCLTIDIDRGVCGACVRERAVQLENDVTAVKDHIACSTDTRAEVVLPVFGKNDKVVAVLDIDSVDANVFDETDVRNLETITALVSKLAYS